MDVVSSIAEVRARVRDWRRSGERVAFVPTMGNLHAGHVSLIEAARAHGDRFVASIFVNPMQFGPNEDFAHYPRTPQRDREMLEAAGCDLMFMPDATEMYPHGLEHTVRDSLRRIPARTFRRGYHGRRETLQHRDAGLRGVRRERFSTARSDTPYDP